MGADAVLVILASVFAYALALWILSMSGGESFLIEIIILSAACLFRWVGGGWLGVLVATGGAGVVSCVAEVLRGRGESAIRRVVAFNLLFMALLVPWDFVETAGVVHGVTAVALIAALSAVIFAVVRRTRVGMAVRGMRGGEDLLLRLGWRSRLIRLGGCFVAGSIAGFGGSMHASVGSVAGWGLGLWALVFLVGLTPKDIQPV